MNREEEIRAFMRDKQDLVKALHQWMESQGVPRHQWGSAFAVALGHEIYRGAKGNKAELAKGMDLAGSCVVSVAIKGMFND